jgi:hypothetical protein
MLLYNLYWSFIRSLTVNRVIISRNNKKYRDRTWGTNDETLFRRLGPLCRISIEFKCTY